MQQSLTGDANEFLMSGFGVICIDKKYLPELALGLACGEPISLFSFTMFGIEVPIITAGASVVSSVPRIYCLMFDLQIMVFTMKLPETDFVFVMDLAALRNTLDFLTDLVLLSLVASSTDDVFALHCSEPGLALNGFFLCSEIGIATVS